MKNPFLILILIVFVINAGIMAQDNTGYAPNTVIVKLKSEKVLKNLQSNIDFLTHKKDLQVLHEKFNLSDIQLTGHREKLEAYVLKFKGNASLEDIITSYKGSGVFEYVEPDYIAIGSGVACTSAFIPNDSYFFRQWGLYNTGTFLSNAKEDADIDMELAWEIEQGNSKIKVAVLDSGIKLDHPEFSGRIWFNNAETPNGTDSDNNGYIDDVNGWDFVEDDSTPVDVHGHGTNVAGILGANGDNGLGYSGVDMHCKIIPLRVLDGTNSGLYSWMAEAMYYAVDHGAKVINMSLGGSGYSMLLNDAADYAYEHNVVIVASMMNFNSNVPYYPAAFDNVIAVGSTDADDRRSDPFFWDANSGSCFGNHIDVVAPGNFMYGLSHNSNTNFESYWGGTSQATPLVSGLCALMLAQNSDLTPDDLRLIIRETAEDEVGFGLEDKPGFDVYYGWGRVNAFEALIMATTSTENSSIPVHKVSISPNPASDRMHIISTSLIESIEVFNAEGRLIYSNRYEGNSKRLSINVKDFESGLYYCFIQLRAIEDFLSEKFIVD